MDEELRFYIRRQDRVAGPLTDDEIRGAVREGTLEPGTELRLVGSDLWAPPHAWATFVARRSLPELPPPPTEVARELPPELLGSSESLRDMLLFVVSEGSRTFGPLTGEQVRIGLAAGRYREAAAAVLDTDGWYTVRLLFGRTEGPAAPVAAKALAAPSSVGADKLSMRCPTCLETIPLASDVCPECDEPTLEPRRDPRSRSLEPASAPPSTSRPQSIPDDRPDASFLAMHWRPLVTIGAMMALVCTGVALRYLAPGRFMPPPYTPRPASVAATCASACWSGETCLKGACVWQSPADVGRLPDAPAVAGPWSLPKDVSDALPLDGERFAVALLGGTQIHNARTGEVLSLVSEAPQSRRLYRVGDVVYATAPQRVYVIDAATTRLLKTIELGTAVGDLTLGASGRRALASLPSAHAVAILATEFHAEIDRIQFGDDAVGPVGTDDTGKRALTTTGQVPLPGLRDPQGGAVYAFDPSRLASQQDRVRASVPGNPVSVLMTPDGQSSYVVVRAESALVPLEWQPSGAVLQRDRIPTCREPEQIELLRAGRRAVVRCSEGRALEVFDLGTGRLLRHIPFDGRAADMAITPDGDQAIVAIPREGSGSVAVVDLESYAVKTIAMTAEPTRVRIAPDGRTALVLSDRAKVAWVLK